MSDYISRPKKTSEPWPSVQFGGVRLWDTYTEWRFLEPQKNIYDWSNLDWWFGLAAQHNADVLYTFGQVPTWASSDPTNTTCHRAASSGQTGSCAMPTDLADWDNFVTALVTHSAGRIKYYELWNEANYPAFWIGTQDQLAEMGRRAITIIRQLQPNAIILSPSVTRSDECGWRTDCGPAWLQSYLTKLNATGQKVDAIAFHAYLSTTPENITWVADDYRNRLLTIGYGTAPMWDTESSWEANTGYPDASLQAGFVARAYLVRWSKAISRSYWYAWDTTDWGTLWDSTSGAHPAAIAFAQTYNWMVGATMSNPCAKGSNGTWNCTLVRPNGYEALAVWNTTAPVSLTPAARFVRYRDVAGNIVPITAGTAIMIGSNPVLLETGDPDGPPPNQSPSVTLSLTPTSGKAPVTVSAVATVSDPDGTISSAQISFGDGSQAVNGTSASHTFVTPGTYTVTATATDNSGATTSKTATVTALPNIAPTVYVAVTPTTGKGPLAVSATITASDSDGTIASTRFDFGDGTPAVSGTNASHTYATPGTYTLTATATDNNGATASCTATVTVVANQAPIVSVAVTPTSGKAPFAVSAVATVSDPDGTIASSQISFGDGTAVVSGTSASHTYATAGTYTVTATATDNNGAISSATASVIVVANQPPTVSLAVTPTSGKAPLSVSATATASDADGTISSTQISFGDGTAAVTGTTGSHLYSTPGTYIITATTTDNNGATASKTATVTVVANQPPTVSLAVTPTSGKAPLSVSATASASDADGTISSTQISFGDDTAAVTGTTGSHLYSTPGTYIITATTTDNNGAAASKTATVTVVANQPPTVSLGVTPTSGKAPLSVSATASASDADGTISSTQISFGDGTAAVTGTTGSHLYSTPGTYIITATTTDNNGAVSSATASVIVVANQPPTVSLAVTPTSGKAPLSVSATATASDADGTISSTQISFGDGTAAVTGTTGSHLYSTPGTYTITATATDNNGAISSATASVIVVANQPPTVSLAVTPTSGKAPLSVSATATASDADGTISNTQISFGDGTPAVTGTTGSHLYSTPGTYIITATTTDNNGATASKTATVTVVANQPPTVSLTVTPTSGRAPLSVTAQSIVSDSDGTVTKSQIDFGDGTVVPATTATHIYRSKGIFTVRATATDDSGASASVTQSVTVGRARVVTTISPPQQTVSSGGTASFALTMTSDSGVIDTIPDLSCAGLPSAARCTFGPVRVLADGSATATMTVQTGTGTHASLWHGGAQIMAYSFPLGFAFVAIGAGGRKRSKRRIIPSTLFLSMLLLALISTQIACGGHISAAPPSSSSTAAAASTPPGTYVVSVNLSLGDEQQTNQITLTVH